MTQGKNLTELKSKSLMISFPHLYPTLSSLSSGKGNHQYSHLCLFKANQHQDWTNTKISLSLTPRIPDWTWSNWAQACWTVTHSHLVKTVDAQIFPMCFELPLLTYLSECQALWKLSCLHVFTLFLVSPTSRSLLMLIPLPGIHSSHLLWNPTLLCRYTANAAIDANSWYLSRCLLLQFQGASLFFICELLQQLDMLLYDIHEHLSCGGSFSQQWGPVFLLLLTQERTAQLLCLPRQSHSPLTLLPSHHHCIKSGKPWLIHQGLKTLVFSSVKLSASQAKMFITPLYHNVTWHILLDLFIILQLPYSLDYKTMFSNIPFTYK